MILVLLSYKADPEEIAQLRAAHREWLAIGIESGWLLAAGRKVPVTGGMFLVRGTLDEARELCAEDPFALADVADYEFIEIETTMAAPGLEALTR